jgi:hypothetical protein
MIQRQDNGDLTWTQDGQIISVSKEDSAMYSPAAATENMQINAAKQNTAAEDKYTNTLEKAQVNVDASRPIPGIPEKPEYITVTDPHKDGTTVTPGVQSTGPWPAPGLPDLKKKTVYKSGSSKPTEEDFIIAPPAAGQH